MGEVPNHLRAISWMDGANGQMKTITDEKLLDEDEKFKVSIANGKVYRIPTRHQIFGDSVDDGRIVNSSLTKF